MKIETQYMLYLVLFLLSFIFFHEICLFSKGDQRLVFANRKISISQDPRAVLILLPNIGPRSAQKIIKYREFEKINSEDQLRNVLGLSVEKIKQMRGLYFW